MIMKPFSKPFNLTVVSFVVAGLLATPPVVHADKPDVVSSPAKPVVVVNDDADPVPVEGEVDASIVGTVPVLVENSDPIPIEGDVDATVQNTVEVEGTVEVQDFDLQLDDLKFRVEEVRDAIEDLEEPDRTPWTYHEWENVGDGETICVPAPGGSWQDTELIVISPENDEMTFKIYSTTDCSPVNNEMLSMGSLNAQFPTVQPLVLPVPLTIGSYRIDCSNSIENCEVDVSFVGSEPAP